VVQNNRLETNKINDIESYTYLKNELNALPLQLNGIPYKDNSYVEQILLVKGWRRYTWQDLQIAKQLDTIYRSDSLKITGIVLKTKKN
jgi:hypothetical protein